MGKKKKCETSYCKNKTTQRLCSTCRTRKQKKESPFRYYYQKLKHRAKERGKEFDLALEQFMLIWLCEPEKWQHKITTNGNSMWEMDRINNQKGYTFDNIQIISKRKNIQKYYNEDRKFVVDAKWVPEKPATPQSTTFEEDVPF